MDRYHERFEDVEPFEDMIETALDDDGPLPGQMCIGLRHLTSGLLLAYVPIDLVLRVPSSSLETCLLQYTLTPPHEVAPGLRCLRVVYEEQQWTTIDHTRWIICFQRRWRARRQRRIAWWCKNGPRHLMTRECTGRFVPKNPIINKDR